MVRHIVLKQCLLPLCRYNFRCYALILLILHQFLVQKNMQFLMVKICITEMGRKGSRRRFTPAKTQYFHSNWSFIEKSWGKGIYFQQTLYLILVLWTDHSCVGAFSTGYALNWSLISLACPDNFPLHAEENTLFQIMVQARHTVFHTQGLHQDGFPLSSVP
jgi:hypothetical protein